MGPTEVLVDDDPFAIPALEHDISTKVPISCSSKTSLHNSSNIVSIIVKPHSILQNAVTMTHRVTVEPFCCTQDIAPNDALRS